MLRLCLAAGLIVMSAPVLAETIVGQARVDRVTLYPGLAAVTRQVVLDLPAGPHEIIIPDLPDTLRADGLRVTGPAALRVGAVNLAFERLPVTPDQASPAILAARAEVERLAEVLRLRDVAIAEIRLRVAAAQDQIAVLQTLAQGADSTRPAEIQALAAMIGAEALLLRQTAFAAEQEAQAAIRARTADADALADARRALEALEAPTAQGAVLSVMVDVAAAGQVVLDIATTETQAGWTPVYDLHLTTGDAPRLDLERALIVTQATGADWLDVALTLSTARPGEQIAPGGVWPQLRRIVAEADLAREDSADGPLLRAAPMLADPVMETAMITAAPAFDGVVVSYAYPGRVDIRDGVEMLRLPLDRLGFAADLWAEAVPASDPNAYRMAAFTNASDEILLAGAMQLYADGALTGTGYLPTMAAGDDTQIGFGPIDGLRLTRITPGRTEGEAGLFGSATQLVEQTELRIENLTPQAWDVLVRDAVPYSEQDDLQITLTATPQITRRDPDGQRGIVEWDLALPAGAVSRIALTTTLRWPSGFVLR